MLTQVMDRGEATASIKRLIIECELPGTDVALFGILCPYCGKTDRIRRLEPPPDLEGVLLEADLEVYKSVWSILVLNGEDLGVCKFCFNPVRLNLEAGLAEPVCE
jgi:hypothetical protein